jgi:hypothetical protein
VFVPLREDEPPTPPPAGEEVYVKDEPLLDESDPSPTDGYASPSMSAADDVVGGGSDDDDGGAFGLGGDDDENVNDLMSDPTEETLPQPLRLTADEGGLFASGGDRDSALVVAARAWDAGAPTRPWRVVVTGTSTDDDHTPSVPRRRWTSAELLASAVSASGTLPPPSWLQVRARFADAVDDSDDDDLDAWTPPVFVACRNEAPTAFAPVSAVSAQVVPLLTKGGGSERGSSPSLRSLARGDASLGVAVVLSGDARALAAASHFIVATAVLRGVGEAGDKTLRLTAQRRPLREAITAAETLPEAARPSDGPDGTAATDLTVALLALEPVGPRFDWYHAAWRATTLAADGDGMSEADLEISVNFDTSTPPPSGEDGGERFGVGGVSLSVPFTPSRSSSSSPPPQPQHTLVRGWALAHLADAMRADCGGVAGRTVSMLWRLAQKLAHECLAAETRAMTKASEGAVEDDSGGGTADATAEGARTLLVSLDATPPRGQRGDAPLGRPETVVRALLSAAATAAAEGDPSVPASLGLGCAYTEWMRLHRLAPDVSSAQLPVHSPPPICALGNSAQPRPLPALVAACVGRDDGDWMRYDGLRPWRALASPSDAAVEVSISSPTIGGV